MTGTDECLHVADLLADLRADVDERLRERFVQPGDPFCDEPYLGAQTFRNDVGVPLEKTLESLNRRRRRALIAARHALELR